MTGVVKALNILEGAPDGVTEGMLLTLGVTKEELEQLRSETFIMGYIETMRGGAKRIRYVATTGE